MEGLRKLLNVSKGKLLFSDQFITIVVNYFSTFTFVIGSIFVSNTLGPHDFGLSVSLIVIPLSLGIYLHLGLFNGYFFEVASIKSKESKSLIIQKRNSALVFLSIISFFVFCFFVFSAYYSDGDDLYAFSLLILSILVPLQLFKTFLLFDLRTHGMFKDQWKILLVMSFHPLLFSLGAYFYGIDGYWISLTLSEILFYLYYFLIHSNKIHFKFRIVVSDIKNFIYLGFFIFISGSLFELIFILDKIFISNSLEVKEVAFYQVASFVFVAAMIIPKVVSQFLITRIRNMLSNNNSIGVNISKTTFEYLLLSDYLLFIFILIFSLIAPFLVQKFLPEYLSAVELINIFLLASILLSPVINLGSAVSYIGKSVNLLFAYIVSLLFFLVSLNFLPLDLLIEFAYIKLLTIIIIFIFIIFYFKFYFKFNFYFIFTYVITILFYSLIVYLFIVNRDYIIDTVFSTFSSYGVFTTYLASILILFCFILFISILPFVNTRLFNYCYKAS